MFMTFCNTPCGSNIWWQVHTAVAPVHVNTISNHVVWFYKSTPHEQGRYLAAYVQTHGEVDFVIKGHEVLEIERSLREAPGGLREGAGELETSQVALGCS